MTIVRSFSLFLAASAALLAGCASAEKAAPPQAPQGGYPAQGYPQSGRVVAGSANGVRTEVAISDTKANDGDGAADAPAPPPQPPPPPEPTPMKKGETGPPGTPGTTTETPRPGAMLVYTARVTMSVYQVEQGLTAVEKLAKDMGGYLSLRHDRDITVRVPRERFEAMLAAVDKIGDVLHRDVQAQDVTDEYTDTDIRIRNARTMQTRLKALLEKAPVKEALEIEKELKRVTEEIELLEGKLKLLSAQIAYSTVTVAFEPRGAALASARVRLPFPWLGALGLPSLLRLSEDK